MRCSKAWRLIHLDRGELPPRLTEAALKHAASCPRCAETLRRAEESGEWLSRLRDRRPVLADPDGFTRDVMRSVEELGRSFPVERGAEWPLSLLPWRGARLALQAGAWCVVTLFLGISLRDAHSMAVLEEQAAARVVPAAAHSILRAGADPGSILRLLRIGPLTPAPEMARLKSKYPGLWSISLEDGLDEQEERILATEGAALLSDLQKLINMGGTHNER